jgi:membrane protein implicated in regulation of membrane protease activity
VTPPTANRRRAQPSTGTKVAAGILVLIPVVALMLVPTYTKATPRLWGFPFFYWYQLLWLVLSTACVVAAYFLLNRTTRRTGDDEGSEQ